MVMVCVWGGAWSIADDALSDMLAGPFLFCVLRVHPGPLPLPFIELRVSQRFPNTTFPCKNWGGRVGILFQSCKGTSERF